MIVSATMDPDAMPADILLPVVPGIVMPRVPVFMLLMIIGEVEVSVVIIGPCAISGWMVLGMLMSHSAWLDWIAAILPRQCVLLSLP